MMNVDLAATAPALVSDASALNVTQPSCAGRREPAHQHERRFLSVWTQVPFMAETVMPDLVAARCARASMAIAWQRSGSSRHHGPPRT